MPEEQVRLGILHAYLAFRVRPARYDATLSDIYPDDSGARQRNLALRVESVREVLAHPQMRNITEFLLSTDDDFLDPAMPHTNA